VFLSFCGSQAAPVEQKSAKCSFFNDKEAKDEIAQ
jgi:hypothetical protein